MTSLRITATKVSGKDLRPGDLFSTMGPDYWDNLLEHGSIGERVYIRTTTPASVAIDNEALVYRIEVFAGELKETEV